MANRFRILAKPVWQDISSHPVIPTLSLDQLRALDAFFDHLGQFALTDPLAEDFLAFASLGDGVSQLAHLHAALTMFDAADPKLAAIDEALSLVTAKKQHKGNSSKGRVHYTRSVSVAPNDLPTDWQAVLEGLRIRRTAGDKRAPASDIQARMAQKLGQYTLVMRREGLSEELHQEGLTAFYADLSTRISSRSGEPLRPATLRATWEELERFARHRSTYSDQLMGALRQTLKTLVDEEANTAQLKYGKLHGIGRPPDIIRDAHDLLEKAEKAVPPSKRHIQRNRAAAFALPAILPLRREWDKIIFGKTLFWDTDRYRFRGYKPGKTALLDGRREFPGSIHPMMSRFVDALVLQDNNPRYLEVLRDHAENSKRPLFVHPNGIPVAKNYVTNVWREIAGTGAQIARTSMHDYFGARGEEGVRMAMIMCNQHSRDTADSYIGSSVGEHELEMVSEDLLDEFEALSAMK
ncbi:hypothetical protein [Halocynthiibacter styelae]|uniref:Uncharacterized protein n=1 Tax=Halocynthiibacter styelae TaxID=2761955 RepID=A0A8J7ILE1_9RHOB|nr:hypothetical protein [Paenihalocynthiibacter styelae]MBI1492436.1 hypothetical protein [Paenihalocynthiibacter styelae]